MKRLCLYLVFDKEGIVDKYIGQMLGELKSCVQHLVVICNMTEIFSGIEIIEEHADTIIFRENTGFDAGGFKEALCRFIGWDTVLQYDELVLVNDSMFGPFRPMKDIFAEMDERSVDFWGLAGQGAREGIDIRCFPQYIQSYFIVIRSDMLHDAEFKKYWENIPFYHEFWDVVIWHEERFTSYFNSLGYTCEVLADMEVNDSKINLANNYSQYAAISYELIKKRNFPFLKKQQIAYNTLSSQTQENLFQAIQYIDKETDYDVNLIWDNIIRTLNMTDLQRSLHLQYIIASEKQRQVENDKLVMKKRIAIIIRAAYREAAAYVGDYLNRLKQASNRFLLVVSENEDVIKAYQEQGICGRTLAKGRNYDLMEVSDYDFVCVLHDTDVTSEVRPSCTGKSYFYCIWENLLKDEDHVQGILEMFEKEERLGFLASPQPNFADYFGELGCGWNGNYESVERIVKELQLKCPLSDELPPFRVTSDFWIRGNILRQLERVKIEDCQYMPYLWSYLVQDKGYYSGIVESPDYAAMDEVNLSYYLKEIAGCIRNTYGDFQDFQGMKEKILSGVLKEFCSKYTRILIYGAGYYARRYKDMLLNVEACIVSDGQKKADYFEGIPIKYLSEINDPKQCGVVLCLNKKNQKQVLPVLKKYRMQNYFCIPE